MSVTKFVEFWPLDLTVTRQGAVRLKTRMRHFKAFSDSFLEAPDTVLAYTGDVLLGYPACPQVDDPWEGPNGETDPDGCFCTRVRVTRDENSNMAIVEAEYSTEGSEQPVNPLDRPPEVSWSTIRQPKVILKDQHGRAITNSAGEPFDPPLEREEDIDVLQITRFEADDDLETRITYRGAVNSDEWDIGRYTFAIGTAKLDAIKTDDHWEYGVLYQKKTYTIHVKIGDNDPDDPGGTGWITEVLDQGYRSFDKTTGKYKTITNSDGTALATPSLLNGDGKELRLARSTLAGGIGAATATIDVTQLDDFPPTMACPFWIAVFQLDGDNNRLNEEVMQVTEVDKGGGTLTVIRGKQGTDAVAHDDAELVCMEPYFKRYEIEPRLEFTPLGITIPD